MGAIESKLKSDYPLLMHQMDSTSFSKFGAEVGPGWYPLVYEIFGLLDDLQRNTGKAVSISQIKTKYGTLRLYASILGLDLETDILEELVEHLSSQICDICGSSGSLGDDLYLSVRCQGCRVAGKEAIPRNQHKADECIRDYARQGLVTFGFCYVQASSSGNGDGNAVLKVSKLPDRILSLKDKTLLEQCETYESVGKPEELREIVRSLESRYRAVSGHSDASDEARSVFDRSL